MQQKIISKLKHVTDMELSKELLAFAEDFETHTGIRVEPIEERHAPHWKRLLPRIDRSLDTEKMEKIAAYARMRFSEPRYYTHLCLKVQAFGAQLAITVDEQYIKKYITKTT